MAQHARRIGVLLAVLVTAAAASLAAVAAPARHAGGTLSFCSDITYPPEEYYVGTKAVGSDIDNLTLSDRRAEEVAVILTETFNVPPENLVTQGYGEEFLKIPTDGPERLNRRVAVRRITPLLARGR